MSCSCANTEVSSSSRISVAGQRNNLYIRLCIFFFLCRSLRRSPRSLRNTIPIAAGMAVSMVPVTRCMVAMRTRATPVAARRYTRIGLIDIKPICHNTHKHTQTLDLLYTRFASLLSQISLVAVEPTQTQTLRHTQTHVKHAYKALYRIYYICIVSFVNSTDVPALEHRTEQNKTKENKTNEYLNLLRMNLFRALYCNCN